MIGYINKQRDRFNAWSYQNPGKAFVTSLGVLAATVAVGYVLVTQYLGPHIKARKSAEQLSQNTRYCVDLETKASTDPIREFVRNKVTITDGWHRGKTCGEVMSEHSKLEATVKKNE